MVLMIVTNEDVSIAITFTVTFTSVTLTLLVAWSHTLLYAGTTRFEAISIAMLY